MVDTETAIDCLFRVSHVAEKRCGGSVWVFPPNGWPKAIQEAWPHMFFIAPWLPDGWIDIVLAMSEHLHEIDPGVQVVDIFENSINGAMQVRITCVTDGSMSELKEIVDGYEAVSETTCTRCGGAGELRQDGEALRSTVLCDHHAGEKR